LKKISAGTPRLFGIGRGHFLSLPICFKSLFLEENVVLQPVHWVLDKLNIEHVPKLVGGTGLPFVSRSETLGNAIGCGRLGAGTAAD